MFRKAKAARFKSDCKQSILRANAPRFKLLLSLKIGGARARTPKDVAGFLMRCANFKHNAPCDFYLSCPEGKKRPSTTLFQNHTPPPPNPPPVVCRPAGDFFRRRPGPLNKSRRTRVHASCFPRIRTTSYDIELPQSRPVIARHRAASKLVPGAKVSPTTSVTAFAAVSARTDDRFQRPIFGPTSYEAENSFLKAVLNEAKSL